MENLSNLNSIDRFCEDYEQLKSDLESLINTANPGHTIRYSDKSKMFKSTTWEKTAAYSVSLGWFAEKTQRYVRSERGETSLLALEKLRVRLVEELKLGDLLIESNPDNDDIKSKYHELSTLAKSVHEEALHHLSQTYYQERGELAAKWEAIKEDFSEEKLLLMIENEGNAHQTVLMVEKENAQPYRLAKLIVGRHASSKEQLFTVPFPGNEALMIPDQLIEDARQDKIDKKGLTKEMIKLNALGFKPWNQATALKAQNERVEWVPYRVTATETSVQLLTGQSTGTAENRFSPSADPAMNTDDLPNIRVQSTGSHLTITCGAIDTEKKVDEFIAVLFHTLEQNPSVQNLMPVRIMLHQLNSFGVAFIEGEDHLILNQNAMSRLMEDKIRDRLTADYCQSHHLKQPAPNEPIVAHMNTSFNFASRISNKEEICQIISLEGIAAQVIWTLETVQQHLTSRDENLKNAISELRTPQKLWTLRKKLVELKNEIPENTSVISEVQKVMQDTLKFLGKQITLLTTQPISDPAKLILEVLAKVVISSIEVQTDRVRVTELENQMLLDIMSETITEFNCKSGLDRTGLARAMWDSMNQLIHEFGGGIQGMRAMFHVINNQDELGKEASKLQEQFLTEKGYRVASTLNNIDSATRCSDYREQFLGWLAERSDLSIEKIDSIKAALHYQDLVGFHMMTVGVPITGESSGVFGLKYGHSTTHLAGTIAIGHNPHPLRRLPMIMMDQEGHLIRNYSLEKGIIDPDTAQISLMGNIEKEIISEACIDLFERTSNKRGA